MGLWAGSTEASREGADLGEVCEDTRFRRREVLPVVARGDCKAKLYLGNYT